MDFRRSLTKFLTIDEAALVKEEKIGHGSFGFVHKGLYRGQPVCIKVGNQTLLLWHT
jgi:hypothetical protein